MVWFLLTGLRDVAYVCAVSGVTYTLHDVLCQNSERSEFKLKIAEGEGLQDDDDENGDEAGDTSAITKDVESEEWHWNFRRMVRHFAIGVFWIAPTTIAPLNVLELFWGQQGLISSAIKAAVYQVVAAWPLHAFLAIGIDEYLATGGDTDMTVDRMTENWWHKLWTSAVFQLPLTYVLFLVSDKMLIQAAGIRVGDLLGFMFHQQRRDKKRLKKQLKEAREDMDEAKAARRAAAKKEAAREKAKAEANKPKKEDGALKKKLKKQLGEESDNVNADKIAPSFMRDKKKSK